MKKLQTPPSMKLDAAEARQRTKAIIKELNNAGITVCPFTSLEIYNLEAHSEAVCCLILQLHSQTCSQLQIGGNTASLRSSIAETRSRLNASLESEELQPTVTIRDLLTENTRVHDMSNPSMIHDIWIVKAFDEYLGFDAREIQKNLEQNYPARVFADLIECSKAQWVEGNHHALHYRGNPLKRGKMWFQVGDPKDVGFVKYFYTGWQYAVLPATSDVQNCPELAPVVEKYNALLEASRFPSANHFIVTHYANGDHSIGMHSDKAKSIAPESLITVVKTGAYARPFRIEKLDGSLIFEQHLEPGTAVVMTLEANLQTKHGVPAVDGADVGSSGSIVFRSITETVSWSELQKKLSSPKQKHGEIS